MTHRGTVTVSEARKNRNPPLTQKELAAMLDVDQTYISLIEAGKRRPSDELKTSLATALGIAPSKLRFSAPEPGTTVGVGSDRVGHTRQRSA